MPPVPRAEVPAGAVPVPVPVAVALNGVGAAGRSAQRLCRSDELTEKGRAVVFDVLLYNAPARAFALRFEGRVVAYLNRCAHVPAEMDWQPGEFLDDEREWILCSIHGAAYDPRDGRCAGGPCGRGRLVTIEAQERDGEVCWYPSRDIRAWPGSP